MPSSGPGTIPVALRLVWELAPKRVLDLGAGYGKYGVLFREYLGLRHSHEDRHRGNMSGSSPVARIDGVEGFASYVGGLHELVYDKIYVEGILDFINREWEYDFIFIGDVLEHLDKTAAVEKVLPTLVARASMGVLVSVPAKVEDQGDTFGNPLEIHRSSWSARDLRQFAPYVHAGRKEGQLIAFLTRRRAYYDIARGNPIRRKLRALKNALIDSW